MGLSKSISMALLLCTLVCNLQGQVGTSGVLSGDQIVERVSPSVVVILVGRGDGQIAAVGSGLIIRPDGVILTANHLVKGMREVQVRLKNGEVYDQVELIASDERRDAAAVRISATGLPALPVGSSANTSPGTTVFLVSNQLGLPWSATSGILSAMRMADEVPGAGSGYRLLQFTAPLAPGSSGGVLVDTQARALGMVIGSVSPGQNLNFAVPVDSIAGLATASAAAIPFVSGSKLQLSGADTAPASRSPSRSVVVPPTIPQDLSLPQPDQLQVRTVSVHSKTIYIRRERFQDDLRKTPLFQRLGIRIADYGETADVSITVDRPFLTFDWTYVLVYQPSNLTLSTGTVEAVDEFDAGPKLAAQIVEQLAAAAVLPHNALATPNRAPGRSAGPARSSPADPAEALRTCQAIMVESHTIWMKGNLLQDALHVRPEIREWEIRIVDDRNTANIYIDVTRPFLTYDWEYKMIDTGTGSVIGSGKVVAIDGHAAAQRVAQEIVAQIRSVRPLGSKKQP